MVTPTKWDKTVDKGSFQGAPNLNVGKQQKQQQEWLWKRQKKNRYYNNEDARK